MDQIFSVKSDFTANLVKNSHFYTPKKLTFQAAKMTKVFFTEARKCARFSNF
jgi:hypothetical protein